MSFAAKCFRILRPRRYLPPAPPTGFRCFSGSDKAKHSFTVNPVTQQMIDYAFSISRSKNSVADESFSQSLLVLEQCQANQPDEDSKGMVLLAMATILYERGDFSGAIEQLQRIEDLGLSSLDIRVTAVEALVGIQLEIDQDDTLSVLTNVCYDLLDTLHLEMGDGSDYKVLEGRVKTLKGLIELLRGNTKTAESFFSVGWDPEACTGNVALSYGEYVHGIRKLPIAQELYQNVIQQLSAEDFNNLRDFGACNMSKEEVLLAATCVLGQIEAHLGNFSKSEEFLTEALKMAEEHHGSNHPKVGVILTCIALMYRQKATVEGSSSLLVQEGLYRKAIELLKAPPLATEGDDVKVYRREIVALARGGYAEVLSLQQNRKDEGERMRRWAKTAWKNRRLSLAEALDVAEDAVKMPVIDTRICRCL